MFIKIKLEPQNLKSLLPLNKISYFCIDDDATIINLKKKIEEYVAVPAERQEIRTLAKVFENNSCVKEVCNVRGSAFMLYAYDESYEVLEPQFVCFVQVYTNELAAQQQELELHSNITRAKENISSSSSTSSLTIVASLDTDKDSEETSSSKSFNSNLERSSSSDSSDWAEGKKRLKLKKKCVRHIKKLKSAVTFESQYPESLYNYLDEFPKCSKTKNSSEDIQIDITQSLNKCQNEDTISTDFSSACKSPAVQKTNEKTCTKSISESEMKETNSTKIQSNAVTTTNSKPNSYNVHPCIYINPDIRDYLAIICSTDMKNISSIECEGLLGWLFDKFRGSDVINNLQFDSKNALSLFEGKLWIACMNLETLQWISSHITKYSAKSYKILALNDSKHLCEVVVPNVSNGKNALDIFDLLEKQNKGIKTLKWSLQSRQPLLIEDKLFNEKAITTICSNEVFVIAIDAESKEGLKNLSFKLKYCFWQLVFKCF